MFILFSIIALAVIDRLSKILAVSVLNGSEEIIIIPGLVKLRLLNGGNTGAAFGMFQGNTIILIIFTAIFIAIGIYILYYKNFTLKLSMISVLLIVAGGIGNLYDRIVYKSVTDFIEFIFIDFPTFNVADIYVTIGSVLLILSILILRNEPFFLEKSSDHAE